MDDLNGLDWSGTASTTTTKAPTGSGNYYPTLRPTPPPPLSGRNTPLSSQGSGAPKPSLFAPPKSSTPDSFSNLVSFGSSKQTTLTLQEQQEKLQAEKRKQEAEKRRQYEAQFGHTQFWDGLGSKGQSQTSTPAVGSRTTIPAVKPTSASLPANPPRVVSPPTANGSSLTSDGADHDLFAAFNSDTKVDNSSYYPPPLVPSNGRSTPAFSAKKVPDLSQPQAWEQSASLGGKVLGDDDDPFGLGQMKKTTSVPTPIASIDDDDDFLGDLGKPVEEVRRPSPAPKVVAPEPESDDESDDPWDKAVAELVDMGFSAEQSRRALTETGPGLDLQAAVGWILNDAHRQAKAKQQGRVITEESGPSNANRRERPRDTTRRENTPAWMQEESRDRSHPQRENNKSPNSETDISAAAAAVGSKFLKTANSFWKQSQKQVQKAVAEFQHESDLSQPKWMREPAEREQEDRRAIAEGRPRREKAPIPEVTDEALMLEGGGRPPPRKQRPEPPSSSSSRVSRDRPPQPPPSRTAAPRWQQTAPSDPKARISKQALEEESAQAYVSPARRKKTPQPVPSQLEPDLLFSSAPSRPTQPPRPVPRTSQRASPITSKTSTPIPTRPEAPARNIPSLSPAALANSTQHRLAGTAHFKLGDYAAAHESYSASLSVLPPSHPITIILLCNRALTGIKTGVPKVAVSDSDTALALIGVSHGDGETIDLGPGEGGGVKEMKEFYGKALTRKAEALEHMEKWKEAGDVWQLCVESGVGASTAIQGRQRCEKALAPKPVPSRTATPKAVPRPRPVVSALSDLSGGANGGDSAAVKRLREANKEAEKADDEKLALADKVDAKIAKWRDGKRDNLRALIGSLDLVMWEGARWKTVGMHELVQNNRVKIHYMKAIGRCHPDKLAQDATTEVKMIAALVFATLNESWDKFKVQNGM